MACVRNCSREKVFAGISGFTCATRGCSVFAVSGNVDGLTFFDMPVLNEVLKIAIKFSEITEAENFTCFGYTRRNLCVLPQNAWVGRFGNFLKVAKSNMRQTLKQITSPNMQRLLLNLAKNHNVLFVVGPLMAT